MASNVIQTTELLDKLNEILAKNSALLDKAAKSGENFSKSLKLPSQYVNQLKTQETQTVKLKNAERQLNTEIKSKIPTLRQLATISRQNRANNDKLTSSWAKLNNRLKESERRYRDLAASQGLSSRATKKAQREVMLLRGQVDKVNFSIKRFNSNVGNYSSAFGKAGFALRNFAGAFGVFSAGFIALDIFKTVKEIDGLDKALKQVTETVENFNNAQEFLGNLSEEAGVEINSLQKAYTKFLASAKTTNLTLEQTNDIFRQTAKAGAVLGLSTDEINGAFRALEQILSKGKVQAEEIRGQLGERLPGAFQILAKSMGLTTQELSKQLELGNVISEEVLPNFAKELEKTFGLDAVKRVETLTASQNRLSNAWNEFIRSLDGSEGTLTRIFSTVIEGITSIVNGITAINTSLLDFNNSLENKIYKSQLENYKELGDEANNYAEIRKRNAEDSIKNIESEIKKNEEILENYKELNGFQKFIRGDARDAQENIDRLSNSLATQNGILKAAEAQLKGLNEERKEEVKTTNDLGNAKRNQISVIGNELQATELLRIEIEKQIKTFQSLADMYAVGSKENIEYTKRVNDLKIVLGELSAIDVSDALASISSQSGGVDSIIEPPKDTKQKWEDTFQSITDVARRAFGIIGELIDASFERQYNALEKQKENAIMFAGESATARAEIERQYEEKRQAIQQKEARSKKLMSIFDITVDTAAAVVRALATGGLPLALVIGALGAAQLALVASQPIPQFWQGGEVGGSQQIMVNDDPYGKKGSNYKEVIEKPNGQILTPQGRNVKMTVPKGSFVHPTYDAFINSLDSELLSNNIMPVGASAIMPMIVNKGLTKGEVMEVMQNQTSRVVETINKQHGININIDENGINKYIKKKGGISKVMNARYNGKGISV